MTPAVRRAGQAAADDPVIQRLAAAGIYVGITSWAQLALVECGAIYPPTFKTAEQRLRFYASRYPITEVDSTFYYPPTARGATAWAARTPPGFIFDVKAFRLLTHHPTPPSDLWPDLREALPAAAASKPTVYARDLPSDLVAEALRRFIAALEPLRARRRLGLVLFQLPRYVYPSTASFRYLEWVVEQLRDVRVAVEFRQRRWMDANTAPPHWSSSAVTPSPTYTSTSLRTSPVRYRRSRPPPPTSPRSVSTGATGSCGRRAMLAHGSAMHMTTASTNWLSGCLRSAHCTPVEDRYTC